MTRRTKAQLEAELANLQARAAARQTPAIIVVLEIISYLFVISVGLWFFVSMWLGHGPWLP